MCLCLCAPFLPSHSLLPLSFSFLLLLALSFLQLLQLHKLGQEEGQQQAKRTSHIFSR